MKAFLLAAGLGTRLMPLTRTMPKCLMPINGIPLLHYWMKLFEFHKITEILLNVHHLSHKIVQFCDSYVGPVKINIFHEKVLSGSLGFIINNKDFINDESEFLVCYSDNLTNINLTEMINSHSNNDFTMGLFESPNPLTCGIVEIDDDFNIISFIEKPNKTQSNLANAGIYVISKNIIFDLDNKSSGLLNISHHLIPHLIGNNKIKGYKIKNFLLDIGTLNNYYLSNDILTKNSSLFNNILNEK